MRRAFRCCRGTPITPENLVWVSRRTRISPAPFTQCTIHRANAFPSPILSHTLSIFPILYLSLAPLSFYQPKQHITQQTCLPAGCSTPPPPGQPPRLVEHSVLLSLFPTLSPVSLNWGTVEPKGMCRKPRKLFEAPRGGPRTYRDVGVTEFASP